MVFPRVRWRTHKSLFFLTTFFVSCQLLVCNIGHDYVFLVTAIVQDLSDLHRAAFLPLFEVVFILHVLQLVLRGIFACYGLVLFAFLLSLLPRIGLVVKCSISHGSDATICWLLSPRSFDVGLFAGQRVPTLSFWRFLSCVRQFFGFFRLDDSLMFLDYILFSSFFLCGCFRRVPLWEVVCCLLFFGCCVSSRATLGFGWSNVGYVVISSFGVLLLFFHTNWGTGRVQKFQFFTALDSFQPLVRLILHQHFVCSLFTVSITFLDCQTLFYRLFIAWVGYYHWMVRLFHQEGVSLLLREVPHDTFLCGVFYSLRWFRRTMLFCVWVVFVSVLNTCSCGSFRLASHRCYDRPFSDGIQGLVFFCAVPKDDLFLHECLFFICCHIVVLFSSFSVSRLWSCVFWVFVSVVAFTKCSVAAWQMQISRAGDHHSCVRRRVLVQFVFALHCWLRLRCPFRKHFVPDNFRGME